MFNDILEPNYLYGAVVSTEEEKSIFIDEFHRAGIFEIQGTSLEKFFFVSETLNSEMIYNPMEDKLSGGNDDCSYF